MRLVLVLAGSTGFEVMVDSDMATKGMCIQLCMLLTKGSCLATVCVSDITELSVGGNEARVKQAGHHL